MVGRWNELGSSIIGDLFLRRAAFSFLVDYGFGSQLRAQYALLDTTLVCAKNRVRIEIRVYRRVPTIG